MPRLLKAKSLSLSAVTGTSRLGPGQLTAVTRRQRKLDELSASVTISQTLQYSWYSELSISVDDLSVEEAAIGFD